MKNNPLMLERASDLIAIELDAKRPTLLERFDGVKLRRAASLRSGGTLKALHSAARDDLEERVQIVFKAFQRVHTAFMPRARDFGRNEAKAFTRLRVEQEAADISVLLDVELRRVADQKTIESAGLTLSKETGLAIRRIDIEIDLYFDQLDSSGQM